MTTVLGNFSTRYYTGIIILLLLAISCATSQVLKVDYDSTFEEKGQALEFTVGVATPTDEVWVGTRFPSGLQHTPQKNAHLWKLGRVGQKIADIEIKYPDQTRMDNRIEESKILWAGWAKAGLRLFGQYSNPPEIWRLQLTSDGETLSARRISVVRGDIDLVQESTNGIYAAFVAGNHLWHIDEDRIDWIAPLIIEENEAPERLAINNEGVYLITTTVNTEGPTIARLYKYAANGNLTIHTTLPDENHGLTIIGDDLLLFHVSQVHDTCGALRLNRANLKVQDEVAIPDASATMIPLKSGLQGSLLLGVRKNKQPAGTGETGLFVLDANRRARAFYPLVFPVLPIYFNLPEGQLFIVGENRGFLLSPELGKSARIVAFDLPRF